MNDSREIKRLVRLLLNGWKILAAMITLALCLAGIYLYQATPSYEAQATLKINEKDSGTSAFWKDFESFSTTGALLSEIEVLRSRHLISKALSKLDFDVSVYRYDRNTRRELYHRSPFTIAYTLHDEKALDREITFSYTPNGKLYLGRI